MRKKIMLLTAMILLLVSLDQVSRAVVRTHFATGESRSLIGDLLKITFIPNYSGFSWFMPSLPVWVQSAYSVLLVLILIHIFPAYLYYGMKRRRSIWADMALVGLTSALAGHLIEMAWMPFTTDFIQVGHSPCANLADLYSYVGLFALGVESVAFYRLKVSSTPPVRARKWLPYEVWRFFISSCNEWRKQKVDTV
jgi:lipoprotein signal peptidase